MSEFEREVLQRLDAMGERQRAFEQSQSVIVQRLDAIDQRQRAFEQEVLRRFDEVDQRFDRFEQEVCQRLDNIEALGEYTFFALFDLLAAMKEDEKMRSQMRARVSEIKATYEQRASELVHRRAS